jgi:hypothetical protein
VLTLDGLCIDPALADVIALALAALFGRAALDKLTSRLQFREVLEAYQVLPRGLIAPAALAVPLIESLIAVALAVGCLQAAVRPIAGVLAAIVLGAYGASIAINLLRGRTHLDCGCSPAGEPRPIGAWMVARNALLAAVALAAALPGVPRELGWWDAPLLLGGLASCIALYMALDFLLGKVAPATALLRRTR